MSQPQPQPILPPPVSSAAQPPRGLSGVVRRAAYAIPEHQVRHWALLILADRLDFLERVFTEQARRHPTALAAALGGGFLVGGALVRRWRAGR
jgi:hypothetical protein